MEVRIKVNLRQVWDLPDRGTGEQERSDAGRALLVPKHQATHKVRSWLFCRMRYLVLLTGSV